MQCKGWREKFFQHAHTHILCKISIVITSEAFWENWKQSTAKSNKPNEIFQMRLPFVVVVQTASPRNSDNKNTHAHSLTNIAHGASHMHDSMTLYGNNNGRGIPNIAMPVDYSMKNIQHTFQEPLSHTGNKCATEEKKKQIEKFETLLFIVHHYIGQ